MTHLSVSKGQFTLFIVLASAAAVASLASYFYHPDPFYIYIDLQQAFPGQISGHPLGGDNLGRDSLARFSHAFRLHLAVCTAFVVLTFVLFLLLRKIDKSRIRHRIIATVLLFLMIPFTFLSIAVGGIGIWETILFLAAPSAYVIAAYPNRKWIAAFLSGVFPFWVFYLSILKLAPYVPNALLGTLINDHWPFRQGIILLAYVALFLICAFCACLASMAFKNNSNA